MTTNYRLIASVEDSVAGIRVDATQPEFLGEFYDVGFATIDEAREALEDARCDADDCGCDDTAEGCAWRAVYPWSTAARRRSTRSRAPPRPSGRSPTGCTDSR